MKARALVELSPAFLSASKMPFFPLRGLRQALPLPSIPLHKGPLDKGSLAASLARFAARTLAWTSGPLAALWHVAQKKTPLPLKGAW